MSGSVQPKAPTTKATTSATETKPEEQKEDKKPAAPLEEDDEFEDFPVEGELIPEDIRACLEQGAKAGERLGKVGEDETRRFSIGKWRGI
jgi:hypothetical protein